MIYRQLNKTLGNIDLYLLDFILKGYFPVHSKILDAGCGEGRNLHYFIQNDYEVYGFDKNPAAIKMLQLVARTLKPSLSPDHFLISPVEDHPYPPNAFDLIICSAVLHFADNEPHFWQMIGALEESLAPQGKLFIRMASDIGIENKVKAVGDSKFLLPDGSLRFLLTRNLYTHVLDRYGFAEIEPIKTVNVADQRCMSTILLTKND